MRRLIPAVLLLASCSTNAEHADAAATPVTRTDSTATRVASAAPVSPAGKTTPTPTKQQPPRRAKTATVSGGQVDPLPSPVVRALYVNRWVAQSRKRMQKLVAIADSTEINALVIDMKDEFGLNYKTANLDFAKNAGTSNKVMNLAALLDTLKAHDILPIARLVVFKDSVTARVHPDWTIRRTDNSVWRDKHGLAWVNPYHHELWEYNIGVAEELVKLGFKEIQFDYIRFPEPYPSLPKQVFPDANGMSKPDALAGYLKNAKERLNKLGVRSTADIFGLVTTVGGPLEVGQHWEKISPHVDVVLPMVYPSHYHKGDFGIPYPNAEPYKVILTAIARARERDKKLGISSAEHVRPWLQAFSLGKMKPAYGAEHIEAQKKAVYDAGYDGWVLWSPGSAYDIFLPALEKKLTSRKKTD
jgi:hypothetical protein